MKCKVLSIHNQSEKKNRLLYCEQALHNFSLPNYISVKYTVIVHYLCTTTDLNQGAVCIAVRIITNYISLAFSLVVGNILVRINTKIKRR